MKTKVQTRQQQALFLARKQRFALAVYFTTGIFPSLPHLPVLATSSSTITPSTLFVSQQHSRGQ